MSNDRKTLCVLISGNGSNLQAIIDRIEAGKLNATIGCVISNQPQAYGLQRAQQAGIDNYCLSHRDYESREAYDEALAALLARYQPDCVVLAGFMRILTESFVNRFSGQLVNIHPSLLPKYKGLNTHQRAIDNGDDVHGVSVHYVTPELDGGPVIVQSRVPVFSEDTADELASRVQEQERQLYPLVLDWICNDRLYMKDNKAVLDNEELPQTGYASD
ncbi:phosphoribosylglycinamide formyltransferase [Alteromonas halophila]|uniref:Phosphoribosylglycinamide formyltransferase n=1 Tax=Alteromonas halophila TaxID=516698 RepID=A0A918JSY5_9ALTE|nr:phosphoribosylglycinamide formyltransferase [Alteromonas halophila]GGW95855.1 phosphoribosylglycinamide formyltransferase [Alteromonas halophila]